MQVQLLKSKIHRAAVTDANVNYEGSLTVDRSLMEEVATALRTRALRQHGQRRTVRDLCYPRRIRQRRNHPQWRHRALGKLATD